MFKHEMGIKAKCRITGLTGIVTSRSENVNMCDRYFLQPRANKDMKIPDGIWLDEDDILKISSGLNVEKKETGGPMSKIR